MEFHNSTPDVAQSRGIGLSDSGHSCRFPLATLDALSEQQRQKTRLVKDCQVFHNIMRLFNDIKGILHELIGLAITAFLGPQHSRAASGMTGIAQSSGLLAVVPREPSLAQLRIMPQITAAPQL